MGAAVRRGEVPEQDEPAPDAAEPDVRPDAQVQRAVGDRHDGNRVQHRARPARRSSTIDDFLAVVGHEDGAHRDARHRRAVHARRRAPTRRSRRTTAAQPAFDALEKAVNDGKIDGFNGNDYVGDLGAGNLAAAFAWSGDVAQITLDNPDVRFAIPDSGGMLWSDNFLIPIGTDKVDLATEWINFFYDPKNAAVLTAGILYNSPVAGVAEELTKLGGDAAALVENPLVVPDRGVPREAAASSARSKRKRKSSSTSGSPRSSARADATDRAVTAVEDQVDQVEAEGRGRRPSSNATTRAAAGGFTPWLLLAPGILFLLLFFFTPLYTLFKMSLSERTDRFSDPTFNWHWANYGDAFSQFGEQFFRSFLYAAIATILALLIGYPLAYVIAFRGGRFRNVLLGLVVVPFFTNFLIRTLAWRTILGNEGWVVGVLRDLGILGRQREPAAHAVRGDRRPHLQLPAVHGAADLRRDREDRSRPRRRGA